MITCQKSPLWMTSNNVFSYEIVKFFIFFCREALDSLIAQSFISVVKDHRNKRFQLLSFNIPIDDIRLAVESVDSLHKLLMKNITIPSKFLEIKNTKWFKHGRSLYFTSWVFWTWIVPDAKKWNETTICLTSEVGWCALWGLIIV